MNIVIIGLGSMGKRRIKHIKMLCDDVCFFAVDSKEDRRTELLDLSLEYSFRTSVYSSIKEIPNDVSIDAAFVCSPPMSHGELINECLSRGWNVFTEINLTNKDYDKNLDLAKRKHVLLYLSSTPLFRNDIRYIIKEANQQQGVLNYVYHVGQYLPDWHPWESYKDFFIGDKYSNGCREIMAIELPWMTYAFGEISSVTSVSMRQTQLDIDYPDCYNILVNHNNGNSGVFIVDVVCRNPVRYLEVFSENMYLTWNGSIDGLQEYDVSTRKMRRISFIDQSSIIHEEGYNDLIVENDYIDEVKDFFEVLSGHKLPVYSFQKDKDILYWIDQVENGQ